MKMGKFEIRNSKKDLVSSIAFGFRYSDFELWGSIDREHE